MAVNVKNITIKNGDRWTYVGGDGTPHIVHTVISVMGREVVTWTDPVVKSLFAETAGFSWLGPGEEFIKNFVRVAQ